MERKPKRWKLYTFLSFTRRSRCKIWSDTLFQQASTPSPSSRAKIMTKISQVQNDGYGFMDGERDVMEAEGV